MCCICPISIPSNSLATNFRVEMQWYYHALCIFNRSSQLSNLAHRLNWWEEPGDKVGHLLVQWRLALYCAWQEGDWSSVAWSVWTWVIWWTNKLNFIESRRVDTRKWISSTVVIWSLAWQFATAVRLDSSYGYTTFILKNSRKDGILWKSQLWCVSSVQARNWSPSCLYLAAW